MKGLWDPDGFREPHLPTIHALAEPSRAPRASTSGSVNGTETEGWGTLSVSQWAEQLDNSGATRLPVHGPGSNPRASSDLLQNSKHTAPRMQQWQSCGSRLVWINGLGNSNSLVNRLTVQLGGMTT